MLGRGHSHSHFLRLFVIVIRLLSSFLPVAAAIAQRFWLNNAVFVLTLTHLCMFLKQKSELFILLAPHPPRSLSLSRLLLDVTLRGLLENACDHSSRLLPWQPGPTQSYQAFPLSETPSLGVRGARARSNTCIHTDRYETRPSSERFSRYREVLFLGNYQPFSLFWQFLLKVFFYLTGLTGL